MDHFLVHPFHRHGAGEASMSLDAEELRARAVAARALRADEAERKRKREARALRKKVKLFDEHWRPIWLDYIQDQINQAADMGLFEVDVLLTTTAYKGGDMYEATFRAVAEHFAVSGITSEYRSQNIMKCYGDGCGPGDDEHRIRVSWRA